MAVKKRIRIGFIAFLFLWFSATFPRCFSAVNQFQTVKKPSNFESSTVFPVQGNVYPLGYYSVSLKIGRPPKLFDLDIDSGSDLTWVQCDAPCTGCTRPREGLYKPNNNLLHCVDPFCNAIETLANHPCDTPNDQCDYEVEYADHGSSLGVVVKDYFPLKFTNGSLLVPHLAFGCGYDQKYDGAHAPPSTAGVLGLGNGKASIVTQLSKLGLIRNVAGHCLSGKGGYIFFGDEVVPSTGITWTPMSRNPNEKHYSSGPAELHFNGKPIGVNGLEIVFDSGSSYTYFSSKAYEAVVNQLKRDLNGKPLKDATDDRSLPVCWKGAKPFKSVNDVKNYFKPFALSFNAKKAQLQLPPEAYLIVTKRGNVCLGVLNGGEVGLGSLNIIGDISLLDKMVIYDNEKQQIGWVPENCDRLPNVDREFLNGFCQPFAQGNLHMMAAYCPANMLHKESSKDRYQ
ncbi:aspartic proteinase Asp1-like [Ziziphus jujuba]|uniref:Aspartic proteinase Asp1-like n=1 Tax=Ziziphus jujuba TaxID=326968 RepID=A0ABM4A8Z3_ZIZJJ|nr:aspartic proteinase Asp1-like [Ziziphus jujuba]